MFLSWNSLPCDGRLHPFQAYHLNHANIIKVSICFGTHRKDLTLYYYIASLVDDLMLIVFGLGANNQGFNDIGVLSSTTWTWMAQYVSRAAWLSGNLSSSSGAVHNSTYGGDTRSNSRDPSTTIPNTSGTTATAPQSQVRITAGVIAGVVSGGVVVVS